jgi:hypothetical protein
MLRQSVVPDYDGSRFPLDSSLEVRAVGEVVIQELQECV